MDRIDIAIVGSGPAGISAALNAKIRNKTFKVFGTKEISPKLVKAHQIIITWDFMVKAVKKLEMNLQST